MLTALLAVLAAGTNAVSSVLQRIANRREVRGNDTGATALTHLLRQPVWLLGILATIVSFGFQAAALSVGGVAQVQPLMALELPITLLVASRVFRRRLSRRDWAAVAAMAAGMGVLVFALHPVGGRPGDVTGPEWAIGAGLTGLGVGGLTATGWLLGSSRGAALFGIGSGVCFALTAVFMSAALAGGVGWTTLARWQTYLVPVAGVAAMLLLQLGLQTGTLVAVQPGVTLADPAVAITWGAAIFAEQVRGGGWLALELAGACAVGWGTVVLSRSDVAASGPASGHDPQHTGSSDSQRQPEG